MSSDLHIQENEPLSTKGSLVSGPSIQYQLQPKRKVIIASFALSAMSTSMCQMVFSPIATLVAPVYGVPIQTVLLTVLAFQFSFLALTFFTIPLMEKSMSMSLRVCAIILVVGSWARWLALKQFGSFGGLIVA